MKNFEYLKVGDRVTRVMGGVIRMELTVCRIVDGLIRGYKPGAINCEEGWTFRVDNGMEVDKDLGWDGITVTGSYLEHPEDPTPKNTASLSEVRDQKAKLIYKN